MEIWKDVPGFEGAYQVSSDGRVRSLDRTVACSGPVKGAYMSVKRGRLLRPGRCISGHLTVVLGKGVGSRGVHTLVLLAFVGPCPPGQECRHKNGDPADNRLDNLEYGTRSQNILDAVRHGTWMSDARRKFTPARAEQLKNARAKRWMK